MNSITYNTYDHRVKELIIQSKNTELFPDIKIPKSTIRSWMNQGIRKVVSPFEDDEITTKLLKYKDLENKYNISVPLGSPKACSAVYVKVSQ